MFETFGSLAEMVEALGVRPRDHPACRSWPR